MKVTKEKNDKAAEMIFGSVYQHYINRIEKNGRTEQELHDVIEWLTSYNADQLKTLIEQKVDFKTFYKNATINPNAHLIKGVICGYRIEDINPEFETYKHCRYLDKLVDELAKGRKLDKILRKPKL